MVYARMLDQKMLGRGVLARGPRILTVRGVAAAGTPAPKMQRHPPLRVPDEVKQQWARMERDGGAEYDEYGAWQHGVLPQLSRMDSNGLRIVLMQLGDTLPVLPLPEFMNAWLERAKACMGDMPLNVWKLTDQLQAKPDREFMRVCGLAARDMQLRNPSFNFHELLTVQRNWGASIDTMRPFVEAWIQCDVQRMRAGQFRYFGAVRVLAEVGCVANDDYVQEWLQAARMHLHTMVRQGDAKAVWNLTGAVAAMPVDDTSVLFPLLKECVDNVPDLVNVPDKRLVSTLISIADCGYSPPIEWLLAVSAELKKRIPHVYSKHALTFLRTFSDLVTPAMDRSAVAELAELWARTTIGGLHNWHEDALVGALAALARLRTGPSVVGKLWFEAWLHAGLTRYGVKPNMQEFQEQQLLRYCRAVAMQIFKPLKWKDQDGLTRATKATLAIRELRDMRTLQIDTEETVAAWVKSALEVGYFRRNQVACASEYLRGLRAPDKALEWESCMARRVVEKPEPIGASFNSSVAGNTTVQPGSSAASIAQMSLGSSRD